MDLASANDYLATSGPSNYEQPLPPMVRANAVIEVAPAKKITFFKSGDPQFSGVKMAINRRSFKSINTLMDDLSSRVPLPFGVRTITTPRGTRCVSRLDQLEDGGCYLCSDKKYVQPFSAGHPGRRMVPQRAGNSISTQRPVPPEGPREEYAVAHSHPAPKIRKKITLVKNVDPTVRRLIIINRRNARNFKTFLEDVSDLLQCTVKKLYTLDGKRIDSMQTVLHSPNVLVCVGREPFKPILTENVRLSPSEQLPGLSSRSQPSIVSESTDSKKNVSFGVKAKKSVIHPRSASSNRTRFSLSSEKSYANGLNMSPMNSRCASFSKPKEGDPAHSLMNDDIEKRVHVNKDGSLSVEMKVRFRLLNDETLQWSTQIKKSRAVKKDNGDPLCVYEEEDRTECRQANNPETFSETDDSFYPCDADSYSSKPNEAEDEDAYCNNCGKQCQDYDIWKNPIHASHPVDAGMRNTWCARSSGSSTSSHRRVMRKQKTSVESIRTTSSEEYTEHFVQQSSCYSKVVESCNSQMDCCIANHCTSRNSRSTATSSVEPVEEMDMVHSDTNPRRSPASEASISNTQNTIDCQESVELPNQGSDSNLQTCCSGCVEPSGAQTSGNMTNMTNHDRQDSNISESALRSRKSKKNLHKTYSTHSKSLSSNHSLSKTDMNEGSRCPPSGNSICSIKEDCCDCDKNSIIKEDCSSISTHKEGTLTSVSVKTMSESERWSTEGSNQSKGSEKERDIQVEESDGICSTEQNERVQQQQCHMHALTIDSTAMLTTATTVDLCESKTNMYESSSQHSEIIPVSVASTPDISTGNKRPHSGSSTGEKCGNRIKFSSGSDLCVSNLTDIKESNDVSFGSLISRQSSKSESFGSKYDCISNPGVERLQSTSSGVSSNSEPKSEAAEAGSMSEDVLSKSSIAHSSERAKRKKETIRAKPENCDRASDSKTASLTSINSPSPPNGKPRNKSRSSKLKHSSTGSRQKEPAHIVEDLRECPDNSRPSTSPSKPITSKVNTENENNTTTTGKDIQNSEQNMHKARRKGSASSSKKKAKLEVGVARTLIGGTREIIPSALPNISAEEVVHEWLKNIPSETLVVEYGETLVVEYGSEHEITDEATKEALNCERSQVAQSAEELFGKDATIKTHNSDPMTEGISNLETSTTNTENKLKAEEIITQENYNDSLLECMRNNQEERELSGFVPHRNCIKNVLPRKVHASVQIMKALFSSPHGTTFDRSNSLPEVSPTMGQKLSNSAKVLITCLAGLKLLDEETMDPMEKLGGVNHNRYIELMNVFQALWIEGPVDVDRLNVDRSTKQKSTMTSDSHRNCSRDAEPTPASSSGVDVNSGSGGSGDGSIHGNGDSTLTNEKAGDCKAIFVDTKTEDTIKAHHEPDVASTPEQDKKDQCCSQSSYSLTDKVREETESNEGSSRTSSQNISTDNITSCGAHCNDNERNEVDENMNETIMDNDSRHLDEASLERDTVTTSPGEDNVKCEKDCPVSNDGSDSTVNLGSNEEQKMDPNISGSQGTTESNSESDCQSTVYFISESNENNGSVVNRESFITDPVWILKLLKKIEKEFMTHYVDAMNEFKVRWNLEENDNLNEMIEELKSEVEKRIQKSVEKELAKIQGRAGNKFPRPPNKMSRQRPTQQTEQRRQRLQTMRKKSLLNDLNMAQNRQIVSNDISLETDEEDLTFSASLADDISADDDFCPCETCIRKKLALRTLRPNTLASNAPIVRAFDLREILRMKKDVTPLSAKNSDTDYQQSLALQNGHADNNGNEAYSTDHGDLDNTGAIKTVTSEHSERDNNEKFKENEFQQNEQASELQADERTIANFSHVNEKGENDLNQGKEENTVEENQESVENKSQHESDHETDVEVADNEGTEDDNKEGGEDLVTAEQISEEEITEVGDCTEPCIEDDQDMKENGPGEPGEDSEMELAEGENQDLDLEDADLESELCEKEGNEENHLLTYTAALPCDSDSHNDCHEQIGDAEEIVESTVDKKDGDAAVETAGSQPEELDVILKEDLNDSQIVEVGGNEECDADQNEDLAGSSNENMEECKAEEPDLSPKDDMDDRTAEESNDIPASDIDENRAEDEEHGQIDSIDGGPPEDLATYTVEANVSKSEEGEPPEENDGHPTMDIDECTTVETCGVLVEEDGDTLEKEDVTPIQEQEHDSVKEFNGGPEEEEDGHLTLENNEGPEEEEDGVAAEEKEEENSCPSKENNVDAEEENDFPGESDGLLAGDVDSGTVEKEEHDGLTEEINGGQTEEIDGSLVEEDSVPPEDINDDPSEDLNGDAAEEADAGPQEEINGGVTDVMEGGAEKEDDAVPPENINDSQTEDMDGGSVENKDAVPGDDNNSDPAEDVAGGAAEDDAGPLEEINGGSVEDIDGGEEEENDGGVVEDINGEQAKEDVGPGEEINGAQEEEMGGDIEEENDGGVVEDIKGEQAGASEQTDVSPVDDMPGDTEQDTNTVCQDLDTVNGNTALGDSDTSDIKPAQMYPDSSSEEEDRDSTCTSPLASNNRSSSLKKSNELHKQSIELDDLDF